MGVQHWENYYRHGALTSCPLGLGGNYTRELHDVWVEFFSGLAEGARILDIGTGNGAVALIARETAVALGRHYTIHATDLAHIDPVHDVQDGARLFAGVRFHAQVATEQLPFDTHSFDAVSGQYALEYAAIDRALGEIRRILEPGGRAQFVIHHADSIVTYRARQSLIQTELVLDETKVFRKLRRHLEAERRSRPGTTRTRIDLAAAVDVLHAAAGQTDNPLTLNVALDATKKLLAAHRHMSPAALDREIDRAESDIRAAAQRLRDVLRCARTEAGMEELCALAQALGFEIGNVELQHHAGDNLVGWRMRLTRV